jgi:hypothetical protein
VYAIVPDTGVSFDMMTDVLFTLDNESPVEFSYPSTGKVGFEYEHLVYSREGLANTTHTLIADPAPGPAKAPTVFLFDYAKYT